MRLLGVLALAVCASLAAPRASISRNPRTRARCTALAEADRPTDRRHATYLYTGTKDTQACDLCLQREILLVPKLAQPWDSIHPRLRRYD